MSTVDHGWDWPPQSRKAHYFGRDRRSLCNKWMVFAIVAYIPPHDDKCAACEKRLTVFLKRDAARPAPTISNEGDVKS